MLPTGVTIRHPDRLFVGGQWVEPASSNRIELVDPNTELVVARVAEASAEDMDRAVTAARTAFDEGPWPAMSPQERQHVLRRMLAELERRAPELARAWVAQVGGLASIAPGMTGGAHAAFAATAALGSTYPFIETRAGAVSHTALLVREPVGVVAAIAPWNAPYVIMSAKVASALIAGCTVIMKPAPETPLEAYILAEAAEAAGLPPGVLNLACGDRAASERLVTNPAVDKVSFTGSTLAGKRIASLCGERIARCTLELGGKSAAIVRDDFPIDRAASILANAIVLLSGQVCGMLSRAIVSRARHDALAEAIGREMERIVVGPSDDPATQLGPLAMKRQLDRVETYIEEGKRTADLVTGGRRPTHLNRGYFIEPTLFANVDNRSRIAQEEIFGPVLSLIPCDDDADAVRIANESAYGLNGAVFTEDTEAAYRIARAVRTGNVAQSAMHIDPTLPIGGFKQSGIGREGGEEGLVAYLETKTILLDALPQQFAC
ncbi:MAG TPA: aldehyde dehydrogenase [Sphingomonadaceae bacterium]|jgi:acyl-CoA reductase-like NAD-dependent aldehyde dehydrogenase|nr:aldehyde dehydrogenase [Sphingomonadaceae bacterium]